MLSFLYMKRFYNDKNYFKIASLSTSYLISELLDLLSELFAVLRVLPLCRLLTLHNLEQMQMLLLKLLHLQM